jgi:hypothetical protein
MLLEAVIIQFLNESIRIPAPVFSDVPKERPDTFITVEQVGGATQNVVIDTASFAIQCYSTSRYNAAMLSEKVDNELRDEFIKSPYITRVKRNSFYNFPEENTKHSRYQLVVDITFYQTSPPIS